jgi:hypothetical protein
MAEMDALSKTFSGQTINMKKRALLLVVSIALILLFGLRYRTASSEQGRTWSDIHTIKAAITLLIEDHGNAALIELESIENLNETLLCIFLGNQIGNINSEKLIYFNRSSSRISSNGQMVDSWGQPYAIKINHDRLRVEKQFNSDAFRIWSFGPNRIDEHGNHDDINSWNTPRPRGEYYWDLFDYFK